MASGVTSCAMHAMPYMRARSAKEEQGKQEMIENNLFLLLVV